MGRNVVDISNLEVEEGHRVLSPWSLPPLGRCAPGISPNGVCSAERSLASLRSLLALAVVSRGVFLLLGEKKKHIALPLKCQESPSAIFSGWLVIK